jgi:hypothetical protein
LEDQKSGDEFRVVSTGACVTLGTATSVIFRFCQSILSDRIGEETIDYAPDEPRDDSVLLSVCDDEITDGRIPIFLTVRHAMSGLYNCTLQLCSRLKVNNYFNYRM